VEKFARRGLLVVMAAAVAVVIGAVTAVPATPEEAQGKTSLWKVSGGKGTVYLMGSIHLLKEEDYPLDARMAAALDASDVVVFEVHPDSLQAPSLQTYILQNAFLGEGETLESVLGDSVYALASARGESLGVNLAPMVKFKPWFVAITIALAEMQKMGFDPALGVEMHFASEAKTKEKTIVGLETGTYQLGLFISLTPEQQRELLLHTLSQLADVEKELGKILSAWKTGDMAGVEETLNRSFKEYPDVYEKLIQQRNRLWVEQIQGFASDGRTHLVIVGVGHMPGTDGLLDLLAKKGFKVEQM
jgi:hypothetical protein